MELAEEMKTCISLAQTLNLEAQNMPENRPAQEAMQHLGSLLASNCEKICIGPSFHLYAPEASVPGSVKPSEMSDNTMKNSTEVIVEEDEEDYETIIYHGRSTTHEANSTYTCQNNAKVLCNGIQKSDSISCTPPQASAHDIESPELVRKNFNKSSCISSRANVSSSGTRSRSHLPAVQIEHTPKQTDVKLPFAFPQMATKEYYKQNHFQETFSYLQERVEIIDDIKKDTEETAWEYWPKKYIEESGFCLGVQPGSFYKRGPYFYVTMPHRSSYEILVTNNRQIPCDVDVYVDGKLVSLLRLPAGGSNTIDGPMYSEFAFKLFRSRDAPPHLGIVEGNHENGIVKAIFTPEKVEAAEERSVCRLLSSSIPSHERPNSPTVGLRTKDKEENEGTITGSNSGSSIPSHERPNSPTVGLRTKDKAENEGTITGSNSGSRTSCSLDEGKRKNKIRKRIGIFNQIKRIFNEIPKTRDESFEICKMKKRYPTVHEASLETSGGKTDKSHPTVHEASLETSGEKTDKSHPRLHDYIVVLQEWQEDKNRKKIGIFSDSEYEEHSLYEKNVNEFVEGVTILQGIKKKQPYLPAPQMETDVSKQVILILRLVASTKEEIEASNEKVSSLEPPPLPSRR